MTDEELRQLQEDAGWIQDLLASPGWAVLTRHVNQKQLTSQREIVQGRCTDFEDYKSRVSFTDGMEFVTTLPSAIVTRMEQAVKNKLAREEED